MIGIIITMKTLAEELVERFGIPIENAKQIVARTRKDEITRNIDAEARLAELVTFNSRLETPVLYAARIITEQRLSDLSLKKREPKIKIR